MYNKFKRLSFLLGLTILSVSCVNKPAAPQTRYYVLDAKPSNASKSNSLSNTKTNTINILPVSLPAYMNQSNMVLKLSDHQIRLSNYHFWAEDIRKSIQRVLISDLNQMSSDTTFTQACNKCTRLELSINHFYPTQSGEVLLAGNYQIIDETRRLIEFSFNTDLQKGGFDESVASMRQLLTQLSAHIHEQVE